jgi:hypothetical protein
LFGCVGALLEFPISLDFDFFFLFLFLFLRDFLREQRRRGGRVKKSVVVSVSDAIKEMEQAVCHLFLLVIALFTLCV